MKIIELYGYSCSGKSYKAKEIKSKNNFDSTFIQISRKNRIYRFINKLSYIFFIKFEDLNFIINIHGEFHFLKFKYKLKNFFSFIYLISFIRANIKHQKSVIIDHGFLQCLFSCYILNKKNYLNHKKISMILSEFLLKFPINFDYKIICMDTDFNTLKLRLKNTNNISNLSFLESNEDKVKETYLHLKNISKFISNEFIDFSII
jgi:hypothetical protein